MGFTLSVDVKQIVRNRVEKLNLRRQKTERDLWHLKG